MKKLLLGALIGGAGVYAYQHAQRPALAADEPQSTAEQEPGAAPDVITRTAPDAQKFHCDGRVYCSQMTSCEEATFFLQNCPGVKMDGEGDGVPCERQWCGSH